ncbi:MAG: hypothetical protein DWQ06_00645, partial [Calditrichaeota bacterium]
REVARALDKFLNQSEVFETESSTDYLLSPTFVGREKQLHQLENAFTKVTNNEGQTVILLGESGIGKSRLVEEFKIGLNLNKTTILETRFRKEGGIYEALQKIILEILDSLQTKSISEQAEILGELANDLTKIAPQISEFSVNSHLKELTELSGKVAEIRLFEALLIFISNFSETLDSPLVLIFDDLQWADETTCSWFLYASRNFKEKSILLLGTCRREELESSYFSKIFKDLKSEKLVTDISLKALDLESVTQFLTSMLGKADSVNSKIANEILKQTNGNPLFVQEIMQHLVNEKKLQKIKGAWDFDFDSFSELVLPNSIHKIISQRFKHIANEVMEILQIGSILGRNFSSKTLAEISPLTKEFLQKKLAEAEKSRLIEKTGEFSFNFTHDATREILELELPKETQKKYHKLIGNLIEERFENKEELVIEDLANHFYKAEISDKAIFYCKKAGENSKRKFANKKALQYFSMGLEVAEKEQEFSAKRDFQLQKSEVLFEMGNWNDAENIFIELLENDEVNLKSVAKLHDDLAWLFLMKGDFEKAGKYYDKLMEIFKKLDDKQEIARTTGSKGHIYFYTGDFDKAIEFYNKELLLSEELSFDLGIARATANLGVINHSLKNYATTIEYFEKSYKYFEEVGDRVRSLDVLGNIGTSYQEIGQIDKAIEYHEKYLNFSREIGNRFAVAKGLANLGGSYYIGNDYKKGIECTKEAMEISIQIGDKKQVVIVSGNLGAISYDYNKYEECYSYYELSVSLARELGVTYYLADRLVKKAQVSIILGKIDEAKILLKEGVELSKQYERPDLIFLSKILFVKIDFAENRVEKAINSLKEMIAKDNSEVELATIKVEIFQLGKMIWENGRGEMSLEETRETAKEALDLILEITKGVPTDTRKETIEELKKFLFETSNSSHQELHSELLTNLVQFMSPESAFSELLRFLTVKCQANTCEIILKNEETGELEVSAVSPNLREEDAEFSYTILTSSIENNKALC